MPLRVLLRRMEEEFRAFGTIFGIPDRWFYRPRERRRVRFWGEDCDLPLGPAAGPHTQLAQNIAAAWLCGGRFIELKTVQKLDELHIDKPCIDVPDEAYNTEWSTELSLEQAFAEYLKAWVILHLLQAALGREPSPAGSGERSFIFNMSVGYDLDGIRSPRMDRFIDGLIDASAEPAWAECLDELRVFLAAGGTGPLHRVDPGRLLAGITPRICRSVTLSTMHGCPPEEIEAICAWLLEGKSLATLVKLNPTLLGYPRVRETLDRLGFADVQLEESSFAKDLQFEQAVPILSRLRERARSAGGFFGVKLTNTLGVTNTRGRLPDGQMYMSGRALHALTLQTALRVGEAFDGRLPVSFCGGAAAANVAGLFEAGIRPITVVTELLKPGGYGRLQLMAERLEAAGGWPAGETGAAGENEAGVGERALDVEAVRRLAAEALAVPPERRGRRPAPTAVPRRLPLLDCVTAPCVEACPIGQDVPGYIRLAGEGRLAEALERIRDRNALPCTTGHICDQPCREACARLHYDEAVEIRAVKRLAAEGAPPASPIPGGAPPGPRVAVIGAGPAGLSAAGFLVRAGFRVTVFEKRASAGGVLRHVLPPFRLPESALERDLASLAAAGLELRCGVDPRALSPSGLRAQGYRYILLAPGAEAGNTLPLEPSAGKVVEVLDFLAAFRQGGTGPDPGRRVVVVGGGNSAMDGARAARRLPGVESVTVLYRRTREEMPADREEYRHALAEGIAFRFLTQPTGLMADGTLICQEMLLGEADESGRRRPQPTGRTFTLAADTLITAIGEHADPEVLRAWGISAEEVEAGAAGEATASGEAAAAGAGGLFLIGDARLGPATVARCMADARRAVQEICRREGLAPPQERGAEGGSAEARAAAERTCDRRRPAAVRAEHGASPAGEPGEDLARREAGRCLECDRVCGRCVEVCPNRANLAVYTPRQQIVHVDSMCNECGNCAVFCPYENGRPYRDKLTLYENEEDFRRGQADGFLLRGGELIIRLDGAVHRPPLPDNPRLAEVVRVVEVLARDYPSWLEQGGRP